MANAAVGDVDVAVAVDHDARGHVATLADSTAHALARCDADAIARELDGGWSGVPL